MVLFQILQRREGIRASGVGVVIQAAAAEIRNIDSGSHGVLLAAPDQNLIQRKVILCLETVALSAAAGEGSEYDNAGTWVDARGRRVLAGRLKAKLI